MYILFINKLLWLWLDDSTSQYILMVAVKWRQSYLNQKHRNHLHNNFLLLFNPVREWISLNHERRFPSILLKSIYAKFEVDWTKDAYVIQKTHPRSFRSLAVTSGLGCALIRQSVIQDKAVQKIAKLYCTNLLLRYNVLCALRNS